jgi:predicted nucleotide-binding protein
VSGDQYGRIVNSGNGNLSVGNAGTQSVGTRSQAFGSPAAQPAPEQTAEGAYADETRNVFVVHGRDEQARRVMFDLLRKLDLRPLEWESLVHGAGGGSPFLGDVVATAPSLAQAALVLLTPDDVVRLHPDLHGPREHAYEVTQTCQPRPNVLLELGMVLMAYPERTIIVEFGDLRPIADLAGRNVIRFDGSAVAVGKIVGRLDRAGCKVDDSGADWRDTRPFRGLGAYRRRP